MLLLLPQVSIFYPEDKKWGIPSLSSFIIYTGHFVQLEQWKQGPCNDMDL